MKCLLCWLLGHKFEYNRTEEVNNVLHTQIKVFICSRTHCARCGEVNPKEAKQSVPPIPGPATLTWKHPARN